MNKLNLILIVLLLSCNSKTDTEYDLIEESFTENFSNYSQLFEYVTPDSTYFKVLIFKVTQKDIKNLIRRDSLENEYYKGNISVNSKLYSEIINPDLEFDKYELLVDEIYKVHNKDFEYLPKKLVWSEESKSLEVRHIDRVVFY